MMEAAADVEPDAAFERLPRRQNRASGREPEGFDSGALRGLHTLRGLAVTLPNAQTWLRLAAAELAFGDTTRARRAWVEVAHIDPAGAATFLAQAGGDTLSALSSAR